MTIRQTLRASLLGIALIMFSAPGPALAQSSQSIAGNLSEEDFAKLRADIENDTLAPMANADTYNVTVVVFSDYQCPYCRKIHPEIQSLIDGDSAVRVVYRDWPLFGEGSREAARLAIASTFQGKHEEMNRALMSIPGKLTPDKIQNVAVKAGVDWFRLQSDVEAHEPEINALLAKNSLQAALLGLNGTPGILIGPYLIPGAVDRATLQAAVKSVRESSAQ
jgi:protein-disulfide isomerase|tara:strand:+ start:2230 stop:2892 length:663 start_codon:yes stop_codon:yes gene_type:complete